MMICKDVMVEHDLADRSISNRFLLMLAVNFTLKSYLQSSNLQTVSLSKFHKSVY